MPQLPNGIRRAFRLARARPKIADDVDAEVAFHLHMRAEELVARGWSREAARAEALRRFGDVQRWSEAMGDVDRDRVGRERRAEWWDAVRQDLRYTLRGLRRQPGFAAGVVLTMALGIGANATMFGIVDRLLLRAPAHVVDAARVRRVYYHLPMAAGRGDRPLVTSVVRYRQFAALRDSTRAFSRLAAWSPDEMVFGSAAAARRIPVVATSAELFPVLGVRPHIGRFFTADEDRPPLGAALAVLGYEFWRQEFGGDSAVLGRTVRIGSRDWEVVGVAPPAFTGVDLSRVDVWLPVSVVGHDYFASDYGPDGWARTPDVGWLELVGRLAPGVDDVRADAELTLAFTRYLEGTGRTSDSSSARAHPRSMVGPVQRQRGPERAPDARVATWLAGVSGLVLLIACANVANLLLARAMRRRREIAVRVALGIRRQRLVAQLLGESVLLALLGGAAGVLIAHWGGNVVRAVLLPDVAWSDTLADPRVLTFAAGAALLASVLAGLAPAVQASRPDLTVALKSGARGSSAQHARTRSALLVAQAALSTVLLVGAGLFLRSLRNVTSADLGFDAGRVLTVEAGLTGAGYTDDEAVAIYERIHERVRELPGVASASLSITTPFRSRVDITIRVPGLDSVRALPSGYPQLNAVTPDYFRTMGTRVVRGRGVTDGDRIGAPRVIVVNETMARLLWPGQDPLGKCVRVGDADSIPCSQVVGVAEEARWDDVHPEPTMQYYVPLAQRQWDGKLRALFVRPSGDVGAVARAVRREVLAAAPKLPFARVRPLLDYVEPQVRPWRLGASMFTAFGVLALTLAAMGLYSVLAYAVVQRTQEVGIRLALGARPGHVLRLIVGDGLRVAAVGVAIGLTVSLAAGRWVEGLLYGVSAHDPTVMAVVAAMLLLVGVAASLVPAWRAARVDPNVALRAE
jgi:predicted permease